MENKDLRALVCLDKKVTDFQIYVDRELQKQDKQIKSHEDYLINTLNGQNKKIDNFIIALGIRETAKGKTISLNDVLDIKHICTCKLTSDTYEEIIGGSNNIFETTSANPSINDENGEIISRLTVIRNDNGSITIKGYTNGRAHCSFIFYNLTAGKTYTFSLRSEGGSLGEFDTFERDENGEFIGDIETSTAVSHTFTVSENANNRVFDWSYWGNFEGETEPLDITIYPQLEEGNTMTDWAPYGNQTETKSYIEDFSSVTLNVTNDNGSAEYTPEPNGTVEVESFSPNMSFETDNEHCNIEVEYYIDPKKYIDKKISETVGVTND